MIKVLIAEDQQMLRGAMVSLLKLEKDIEVVAEVSDGIEARKTIEMHEPDICILDIEMPNMTGIELAECLKKEQKEIKIIIVTTFARPGYLQRAKEAGIEGYLLKDEPIDCLIESIRKVMRGESVISPELAAAIFRQETNPLTEREIEMLRLASDGLTTDDIVRRLFLTKGTVRNYLSSAIQKLGVSTRQQAIDKAIEKGWI